MVVFLQGWPRHEGLGVDEQLLRTADEDTVNTAIQVQHQDISLDQALEELHKVHVELLLLLAPLSDDDLYRANSDYQP